MDAPFVSGIHDLALALNDCFLPSAGSGRLFKLILILGCCCAAFNGIRISGKTVVNSVQYGKS